jgi:hypothetical protein
MASLAHPQETSSRAYTPPGGKKMFFPATPRLGLKNEICSTERGVCARYGNGA